MRFIYAEGATPLSPDEIHNLIPKHLTTQKELNEWEQFNIVKGENWAFGIKRKDILIAGTDSEHVDNATTIINNYKGAIRRMEQALSRIES